MPRQAATHTPLSVEHDLGDFVREFLEVGAWRSSRQAIAARPHDPIAGRC
jgi:hypothetical protein